MSIQSYKVVLLGEGRAGKSSICLRYVKNSFSGEQQSTIEAAYLEKKINLGNKTIRHQIWDTAGQEKYHALSSVYYRDAQGALLVYDITDRDSFTKAKNWVKELRKIVGKGIAIVIAGNKSDLEKHRQVDDQEALEYAQSVGAAHVLCSAKTGKNIEQAFLELTKQMVQSTQQQAGPGGNNQQQQQQQQNTRTKIDFAAEDQQKGGCC